MIRQRTANDCLIAATATAANIDYDLLLKEIGHDGQDVVFPALDVEGLRGFHPQEVTDALIRLGFAATEIEVRPVSMHDGEIRDAFTDCENRFFHYLMDHVGVLDVVTKKGNGHAIAVIHGTCYDPKGRVYPVSELENQGVERVLLFRIIKSVK